MYLIVSPELLKTVILKKVVAIEKKKNTETE